MRMKQRDGRRRARVEMRWTHTEGVVQHSVTVRLHPPSQASIPHRGKGQDKPYFTSSPNSHDARYATQLCRLPTAGLAQHGSLLNSVASVTGLSSDQLHNTHTPTYPSSVYAPLHSYTRFSVYRNIPYSHAAVRRIFVSAT